MLRCTCVPGVIGRRMKMDAFREAIPEIVKKVGPGHEDGHRAAVAITTTGEDGVEGKTPGAAGQGAV